MHIRIERASEIGRKRVATRDRILAVDDDGLEVDISGCVRRWAIDGRMGEPEVATLEILGVHVVDRPELLDVDVTTFSAHGAKSFLSVATA